PTGASTARRGLRRAIEWMAGVGVPTDGGGILGAGAAVRLSLYPKLPLPGQQPGTRSPDQTRPHPIFIAAAHPIPSFLQLPIEGLADEEAESEEQARPRSAGLARGGSLRLTHPVRLAPEPVVDDRQPAARAVEPAMPAAALAGSVASAHPAGNPQGAIDREAATAVGRDWLQSWEMESDPAPAIDVLVERLGDARRHFHNLDRVAAELRWLDTWRGSARDPVAVGLAIWFRYAVRDPARCDNEARSGEFARIALAGLGMDTQRIRRVRELIVAT